MSLRKRFLTRLRDRLNDSWLPLRICFWDGEIFDFTPAPSVTIILRSRRLLRWFLSGNIARLAQDYVTGEIGVEGRLKDVIEIGITIAERVGGSSPLRILSRVVGRHRHTAAADAAAIRYHSDVSNDFYRLWLDRNMVYSCANFATGEEDLDTAQEQKLDHILPQVAATAGRKAVGYRLRVGRPSLLGSRPLRCRGDRHNSERPAVRLRPRARGGHGIGKAD